MIYFIMTECENIVKIGLTTDVEKRFETIRTVSPLPVKIETFCEGGFQTEALLHRHFSYTNNHHEWFFVNEEIIELITYIKSNGFLPKKFFVENDTLPERKEMNVIRFCTEYEAGDSISTLSRKYQITRSKCRRILSANGIRLRTYGIGQHKSYPLMCTWKSQFDDGDLDIYIEGY